MPAENLLGVEGRGFQQLAAGLQRERIMAAVLALSGAAPGARGHAAPTCASGTAFGEPLADKQALRHRVADMATEIEAARQLVYHAAALYTAGEDCVTEVSMAKLFATEVANRVAYRPCSSTAATATCASSRSSASSATCGCGPSPRARRR